MLTNPLCSTVLILNPNVGEIWVISSPINFFRIVVFPALSRPLNRRRRKEEIAREKMRRKGEEIKQKI